MNQDVKYDFTADLTETRDIDQCTMKYVKRSFTYLMYRHGQRGVYTCVR